MKANAFHSSGSSCAGSMVRAVQLAFLAMTLCSCASQRQNGVFAFVVPLQDDGNVAFYLSNQSGHISPIDIELYVDDRLLATADVPSGPNAQHKATWKIQPGRRKITVVVRSIPGLRATKEIEVEKGKGVHLAVDFSFGFPAKYGELIDWPTIKLSESDVPPAIY